MTEPAAEKGKYLISLFIGPVQDFIAAALRTRDLWFGSHMLSEVSKAAAKDMDKKGAQLIFPVALDAKNNVANRIVALVDGDKVQMVKDSGKRAARERLAKYLAEARQEANKVFPLREKTWQSQANPDDLLELYFTAVPLQDSYTATRQHLDQLTFARKNSRDFFPSPCADDSYGLPKSSLDGRRKTVLPDLKEITYAEKKQARRKLRLREGEQLDALGVVKRLAGGKADQFTPTTRMAVDPWVRNIAADDTGRETLEKICIEFDELANDQSEFITRVKGNKGIYDRLPYDGGLLYPGPLGAALRDSDDDKEKERLSHLQKILGPVWKIHGKPDPYYAMLRADGDSMGDLLDQATEAEEHRKISEKLAGFAREVPEICQRQQAQCIYAGGDDVLALSPLDTALDLADCLRNRFHEVLKPVAEKLGAPPPTFSVGLVIAHMQTPMGRVRRLTIEAEKLAKGTDTDNPRNALGLVIAPRSGVEIRVRFRWDEQRIDNFMELTQLYREGLLPGRFAHGLQQMVHELPAMMENSLEDALEEIKKLEFKRILQRKNISGSDVQVTPEVIDAVLRHAKGCSLAVILPEHLAARWLSGHGEDNT